MELRENPSYLILAQNLKDKQVQYEDLIFNENKYNNQGYDWEKRYSTLDLMVIKRNLLKAFVELPDDLLDLFNV